MCLLIILAAIYPMSSYAATVLYTYQCTDRNWAEGVVKLARNEYGDTLGDWVNYFVFESTYRPKAFGGSKFPYSNGNGLTYRVDDGKYNVNIYGAAGRLHNKVNLMNELKKIKEVMKKVMPEAPDEVMLVLDGSTGQNAFEQAKQFSAVTNISSLAITKLDGTAKGGVVIGISDQLKVPVKYIGLGEGMEDLQLFNKTEFVDSLFKN